VDNADRRDAFELYLEENPEVTYFARYRARVDESGSAWPSWPHEEQEGRLQEAQIDPRIERFHLYAQWVAGQQIDDLCDHVRRAGGAFYLDLPVGVPRNSYDVWRYRDAFAEASTGAPPDTFFLGGQDWGFPPPHPERIRSSGYAYFVKCLRHHLRTADMLRIDHFMGLHRLYWVPDGAAATEGVYVRYRAVEHHAILCLEAERHGATLVGEDLGTVPSSVRRSMDRHGIWRMYALQTELLEDADRALPFPGPATLACLNTHDMPPFAAFLEAEDVDDLEDLGQLDEARAADERHSRHARTRALVHFLVANGFLEDGDTDPACLLRAALEFLAHSHSPLVIVNLEDLWQEVLPQNVPGTTTERPNWQRKAELSLEEMRLDPRVSSVLDEVTERRQHASAGTDES
jgi:4-alpha-glucanotransferase